MQKFLPFFVQATQRMVENYGADNKVNYYNIALGGSSTFWGKDNVKPRIDLLLDYYNSKGTPLTDFCPDIIYIKYFANDASNTAEDYYSNMKSILEQFKKLYPTAAVILVSGKLNNEKSVCFKNRELNMEHEKALEKLAEDNSNCIVAKVTSCFVQIVKSKNFEDYLSNNINHANDFWATVVAQVIAASAEI